MSHRIVSILKQSDLLKIPESIMSYWLSGYLLSLLQSDHHLEEHFDILQGMATADDNRCLRFFWEIVEIVDNPKNKILRFGSNHIPVLYKRFFPFTKGGGKNRWAGNNYFLCEWEHEGARIRARSGSVVRNEHGFGRPHYSYSLIARGVFGARAADVPALFGHKGPGIFPPEAWQNEPELLGKTRWLQPLLQSRVAIYLLRAMSPSMSFEVNTVAQLPIPAREKLTFDSQPWLDFKWHLLTSDLIDRTFDPSRLRLTQSVGVNDAIAAWLATGEALLDEQVRRAYGVNDEDFKIILADTGTPAGFHPLLTGYDALPELPAELDLPPLPGEVLEHLAQHQRIAAPPAELARHKARLRALYEAGPGAKEDNDPADDSEGGSDDDGEAALSGAHIPIPTETFLEELSVKMQLHPISVYHLLHELRAEGARCKPEERRLLEDRLSVLVLRLLGHRWPRQLEAGEPVPGWADPDGIIPLGAVAGESSLAERVRARLRAEDGDLGAQRAEALLADLTGHSLEDWLRREFFKRHIKQFKYRPVAWHLASDPSVAVAADAKARKRLGARRQPAFECLVYYHACGGELLARLRTQYVEPLLRAARQQLEQATRNEDEAASVQATMRIQELEEFARRLVHVAERGFACPELDTLLAAEPLDRWSGDGYLAPADGGELLRQEQGWRVDLNDGVRVNIAPLQQAGLLAADVLKAADAKKAIADRARWRSDERRWVRAGKLPRCGWLPEGVLESPAWTDLAPQRAAEQAKLEEKRRAAKLPEA